MADSLTVQFMRVRPDADADLPLPRRMSGAAAGLDLCAAVSEPVEVATGERRMVPTGFAVALPVGFEGQVRPRSGLAARHGVTLLNSPGTIDADYRGEIRVILINHGDEPFRIERGARIAQLVVASVVAVEIEEVSELSGTERGSGGFGSTGDR